MPKSSIAIRTPNSLDAGEAHSGLLDVAHDGRLGDLERERVRVQRAVGERPLDIGHELVTVELARGDVDGHADRVAGVAPAHALVARLVEDPATDFDHQPGLLQQRDEVVRLDDAARGALPADQRLHARGAHLSQVERRLVDQEELVVLERHAQVHLELHPRLHRRVHARFEDHVAVAPVPLGLVHGHVGVAQQLFRAFALAAGDADARGHLQRRLRAAGDHERLLQRFQQALGDELGAGREGELAGDHHELIAAESSDGVGLAHHGASAVRRPRAAAHRRPRDRASR